MQKLLAKIAITSAFLVPLALAVPTFASADTVGPINFESPTYTIGTINGQNGWVKTGSYDAAVSNTNIPPSFGAQSLRISDATTSDSFGDQTFSPSTINEAGETTAVNNGFSGGTRQNHFEVSFSLASVLPTLQAGMHVSVSPDRGDGARMSYLRFEDQADGIHVFFDDVTDAGPVGTVATFNESDIATLTRTPHTIKFVIDFVDGPANDVVKIYIDGVLKASGTTWEDYYRYDPEQTGGGNLVPTVDSLLFRESGTANAADAGNGFLIDNLTLMSGPGPVFIDTNANHVLDVGEASFGTIQAAVNAATNGNTIQVTAGTYPEHVAVNKSLTINGANWGATGTSTRVVESIVDGSDTGTPFAITANHVTINGFTVENGSNGGFDAGIWSQTGTTNSSITNNIITGNAFGVWAQCGGVCVIAGNLFDGNNKVGTGAGSASISADSTTGLTINNNEFKNDTAGNPILLQETSAGAHTNVVVSGNNFHNNANSNIYALGVTGGVIRGNTITPAVDATGISLSGLDTNVSVMGNIITGGARGVRVENVYGVNSNVTVNRNNVSTNSEYGVGNTDASITNLDATCNWWGAANGPSTVGTGSGSPVTTNVNYTPWLTTSDLANGPCNGPIASTVKVTIDKFIDGQMATSGSANNSAFPMSATWNATNIGAGTGTYTLSTSGFNSPNPYEAITSDMTSGASYSTNEVTGGTVVGASCSTGQPYSLVGYSAGDNLAGAMSATPSLVTPNFTNITTNKFVIVWNHLCSTTPPATVPTTKEACMSNGWKTLVDSSGHSFKNQGDCVSFVATKGKNKAAGN